MPPVVGSAVPRKEATAKLTGRAQYVEDVSLPGMLWGATYRSSVPRALVKALHFDPAVPWDEYTVVTAKDIPGENHVHLIFDDQPCLVADRINHSEEPIVLVAHARRDALPRALAGIRVEVEPLPAILSIDDALAAGQSAIIKEYLIERGDVAAGLAQKDAIVVEGVYETGAQEQLYIENNGMIAVATPEDGVTVWGSLQCPYYVQKALMPIFAVPADKARVVQLETGGGFGGKEEYPSILAAHAALLSLKSGRPVKMIYDRGEDMAATTKRHPSRTRHKTAFAPDGRLLAMDIDFVIDGGAYATLSQVVLSRGSIHAAGPYECPNIRVRGRALATNTPPHGAFRGFGAPQSLFALERHLDECAKVLGRRPEELRKQNFVHKGGTLATGQLVRDDSDMDAILATALAKSDWHAKKARFAAENQRSSIKRGMGLACFLHGTGFTGSGEKHLASIVGLEGLPDGRVRVLAASTEIGQGTNTVFAQIAADALGIPYDDVEVATPDTAFVPNSGPTVASRTVTIVGKLVERAAEKLVAALGGDKTDLGAKIRTHVAAHGPFRVFVEYEAPPFIQWDDDRLRGDAYGAFSWATYVAQVAVDTLTYEARVEEFWAVQEVGKVMHPLLAEGQIEGGVAQGVGWALTENVVWKDGRMLNNRMTDYIIPTAVDMPRTHVVFCEAPYAFGPHGAKGIGELPLDGPAPAVLNAIRDAIGVSVTKIPAVPEVILEAVEAIDAAR
jgi:CO/xanthine dehydrogenase Mo-binding subunit